MPTASVARAVIAYVPSNSVGRVSDQFPNPLTVTVPRWVPLTRTVTVTPGSAVPWTVGVGSLVRPPLGTFPVTGSTSSTTPVITVGAGAVVSTVNCRVAAGASCGFPARSTCVAVTVMSPSPKVARSPLVSVIGPPPIRVFSSKITLFRLNTALIVAVDSPVTSTTPPDASARPAGAGGVRSIVHDPTFWLMALTLPSRLCRTRTPPEG